MYVLYLNILLKFATCGGKFRTIMTYWVKIYYERYYCIAVVDV